MKLYHVDAFTKELFKGNPAGVCILRDIDIPDTLKQRIAAELKHSETAFVLLKDDKMTLRWFTPKEEVDLCGHATLSAAHILWEQGYVPKFEPLRFDTLSGLLTATLNENKIELDFPRRRVEKCENNLTLNKALGIKPLFTGKDEHLYMIEIADAAVLRALEPDMEALNKIAPGEFLVTARSDDPAYDFMSRFFAPAVGIPEDPVTGSAHCYLAPYWSEKLGKTAMIGLQVSARTGIVECELSGNKRVLLRGEAITFSEAIMNTVDRD